MDYQGIIIRPPSEAFSIILQVTLGCSHNRCTFCGTYRNKPFQRKDPAQVELDLDFAAKYCQRQSTLFLADGDALALPHEELLDLLARIRTKLPWVRRISSYASAHNIMARSDEQLHACKKAGLSRLYMGLESGHDPTLLCIAKGMDSARLVLAGQRVQTAGMFLSASCLLGIAGQERSKEHACATAEALNRMRPQQIAVLTLMLLKNTPLYAQSQAGLFFPLEPGQILMELRTLLVTLLPFRCQFHANHSSNALPLRGRLPKDKDRLLACIEEATRQKPCPDAIEHSTSSLL